MFSKLYLIPALCAVALAFAGATPAQAQTATPQANTPVARKDVPVSARMSMKVGALVMEDLRQFVTDDKTLGFIYLRMVLLAKQEAIGVSCAAYELDQKRMVAAMFRTMGPLTQGVEKDVAQGNLQRALRQYNTLLGGEIAVFAYDPAAYCEAGKALFKDLSEDKEAESMFVLRPTAT